MHGRRTPPPPPSPPRNVIGSASDSPSADVANGSRATALSSVLEQMDKFFRADQSERQSRLRMLEQRQQELQRLMEAAAEQQQQQPQRHGTSAVSERASGAARAVDQSRTEASAGAASRIRPPLSAAPGAGASEGHSLAARYNDSVHDLVEECRTATDEVVKVRAVNERLVAQLEEREKKIAGLNNKMEQLARNVVKAIRERNHFEDLVQSRDAQLAAEEKAASELKAKLRAQKDLDDEVGQLRAQLQARTREIAIAHEENGKVAGMLEKAVADARQVRRELQDERDNVIARITEQLADTVVERDEALAALAHAQATNDRLADELLCSVRHMKLLDEKLAASDRALSTERTTRIALEREVTAFKGAQGVAPYGISAAPFQSTTTTAAIRDEVGRLQSLLDGAMLENSEHARRAESRIAALTTLNQQLSDRCKDYEGTIAELRREVALVGRERTQATLVAQRFRNLVLNIQQDAAATSEIIMTTRSDAEEAVANAQDELSLRFAQQALSDFASIAQFFGALRRVDVVSVAAAAGTAAVAPTAAAIAGVNPTPLPSPSHPQVHFQQQHHQQQQPQRSASSESRTQQQTQPAPLHRKLQLHPPSPGQSFAAMFGGHLQQQQQQQQQQQLQQPTSRSSSVALVSPAA